ncbi:MAG: triose-phosphate isomerase [Candidatus Omnitrophota bacterium]
MRRPIIAGNWKMYTTVEESVTLANGIKRGLSDLDGVDVLLCPPFTSLWAVSGIINDTNISLGAQNMYWDREGAFTGEISASMLKSAGCKFVIIGHSERRAYFGETNETVNRKVKYALAKGLMPIMCVGEKLEEREGGKTFDVISSHIEGGLADLSEKDAKDIIIAYEPVWAIGTGKNATPDQAEEAHKFIRGLLADKFGKRIAEEMRIQYGGSVKPDNIEILIKEEDIDGALVGGASLKPDSFIEIVKKTEQAIKNKVV